MGFNDLDAANLKPKSRGLVGASMPSRRPDDPRHSRSEAPLLNDRMLGEGLRMEDDGRIALDFSLVERALPNYSHERDIAFHSDAANTATDTTPPSSDRLLFNSARHVQFVDLSLYRQIRFQVNRRNAAGHTGSTAELQYSASYSNSRSGYVQLGSVAVSVPTDTTNTVELTDWIDIVPEARAPVYLAIIATGGNSTASPTYGAIKATVRR